MQQPKKNRKRESSPFIRFLLFFRMHRICSGIILDIEILRKRTHNVRAESGETGIGPDAADSQGDHSSSDSDDAKGRRQGPKQVQNGTGTEREEGGGNGRNGWS